MLTKLHTAVVTGVKRLHEDEAGDAIQSLVIGAIGVLLAAAIFQTMKTVIGTDSSGMGGMVSGFITGIGGAAKKLLSL